MSEYRLKKLLIVLNPSDGIPFYTKDGTFKITDSHTGIERELKWNYDEDKWVNIDESL